MHSTTPYTSCHLLCLPFFKSYYLYITVLQLFIILWYIFTLFCNFLLTSSSLFLTCAVHIRTRSLQMDVELLQYFKGNVNTSPIVLSHTHSPAYFRLCHPFYDESCLKFSSLCYSQAIMMPESSVSLAAPIPWSRFIVTGTKVLNMTTLQPGVDMQYVSLSFPFSSMIQGITTWALLLFLRPKCSQLPRLIVLEIFVLSLLKHRFWTFLRIAMEFRLWTVPDLCKDFFIFPYIFPDATCSSHLLPHPIPLV